MAFPADPVHYEFLRETLLFGLNMVRMAQATRDQSTASRAQHYAYKALRDYDRFRAGVVLPLPQHQELRELAIELCREILSIPQN